MAEIVQSGTISTKSNNVFYHTVNELYGDRRDGLPLKLFLGSSIKYSRYNAL